MMVVLLPNLQTSTGIEMQSAEDVILELNADTDNADESHNPA